MEKDLIKLLKEEMSSSSTERKETREAYLNAIQNQTQRQEQSTKELGKVIGTSNNTIKQKEVGLIGMFEGFSPEQLEGDKRNELPIETKQIKSEE